MYAYKNHNGIEYWDYNKENLFEIVIFCVSANYFAINNVPMVWF